MTTLEWLNRYVLPNYLRTSTFGSSNYVFEYFEVDFVDSFESWLTKFFGRILYTDENGKQHYTESMQVGVLTELTERSKYYDINICNEIFAHTKILQFFYTLNKSVYTIFPKFVYSSLAIPNNESEAIVVILEDLRSKDFRKLKMRQAFSDVSHVELAMKKLGEFHAFSYQAKTTNPEVFQTLRKNLKLSFWAEARECYGYFKLIKEFYFKLLSEDERYKTKTEAIGEILKETDKYIEEVLAGSGSKSEERVSVFNIWAIHSHREFLFKYNAEEEPVDCRIFDLQNIRYGSPMLDVGAVLYMMLDQETRDKHWDQLLSTYYKSLRDAFPGCNEIPTEEELLAEFRRVSLVIFLLCSCCIPYVLECSENPNLNWYYMLFGSGYEEYKYTSWIQLPVRISSCLTMKAVKSKRNRIEIVLNILRDMIDRGFV